MGDEDRLIHNRYRLTERVGSGAMGVVWRARDEVLGRTVAVKQLALSPSLPAAEAADARERARREARIAARIRHPNAVTLYDVVEEDGLPWLVMEYVPSRSLAAAISADGVLTPREVARIGARVAAALAAAHEVGVVHRDVKPGNILLGDEGVVKIADFGISRAVDDVVLTSTGLIAGTPAYLSPEMARGGDPTPASDVFALGSTLYAAVEGEPPFGITGSPLAILHAVASGRVRPPKQAGPLERPLMLLLRADAAKRPTIGAAQAMLAELAGATPLPARFAAAAAGTRPDPRPSKPTRATKATRPTAPAKAATPTTPTPPTKKAQPAQADPDAVPAKATAPAAPPEATMPSLPPTEHDAAGLTALSAPVDDHLDGTTAVAPSGPTADSPSGTRNDTHGAVRTDGRNEGRPGPANEAPARVSVPRPPAPSTPSAESAPPPVTPPTATPPGGKRPGARRRSMLPRLVAAVVAAAAVVAVGVVLTVKGSGSDHSNRAEGHNTSAATATGTAPATPTATRNAPSPTETATNQPTTAPTTTRPPSTAPPQEDLPTFITRYYSLLPGNRAQAWTLLSPAYQGRVGRDSYDGFWSTITSVQVRNARATGPNTAAATLVFHTNEGRTSTEPWHFTVIRSGGSQLIDSGGIVNGFSAAGAG